MKAALLILSILSTLTFAQAASYVWISGAGGGNWNTASNWDNGVPTGQDSHTTINNGGVISGTWSDFRNGSLTVSGNTTLNLNGAAWVGNLNIGQGSIVNTSSATDFNGELHINGTLNLTGAAGYKSGAGNTINLMTYGQINRSGNGWWWPDKTPSVTGVLDGNFSLTGSNFEVVTRVLMTGCDRLNFNFDNSIFTASDSSSLTKKTDAADIIADASHLGNYRVYVEGTTLKVDYVSAVAIPESSTATLGILALSCLLMKRRRAH